MEILYFILPLIGGLLLYALTTVTVRAPGKVLAAKFASLGNMTGKTYAEIRQVVGVESSVSRKVMDDGSVVTIRQWMATGYHIVLLFDQEDKFICISSETSV